MKRDYIIPSIMICRIVTDKFLMTVSDSYTPDEYTERLVTGDGDGTDALSRAHSVWDE